MRKVLRWPPRLAAGFRARRPSDLDFRPWLYRLDATPEQREFQRQFRDELVDSLGASFGNDCFVSRYANYEGAFRLGDRSFVAIGAQIGSDVTLGEDCSVNAFGVVRGKVHIGNMVRIGSQAHILGFNHGFDDPDIPVHRQPITSVGIHIGDDVWIGSGAMVLDGVSIGGHSVVAAGSVVTRNLPEYSIAAGNPARAISDRRTKRRPGDADLAPSVAKFADLVEREWREVLANCTSSVDGVDAYLDPQAGKPTARAWADAVEIATMFSALPDLRTGDELIRMLQAFQDETTGLVPDPWTPPPPDDRPELLTDGVSAYNVLAVGYALECLGSHLSHPVHVVETMSAETLYRHLSTLAWAKGAWGAGAWVDHYGTSVYHNLRHHSGAHGAEAIVGWLDTHVNRTTGLWGEPTAATGWLQPVNGSYRLVRGTYAQFDLPVPHPEDTIDTVLAHCRQYDDFLHRERTACNVLDVVHSLWMCSKQTAHRRSDIMQFMEHQLSHTLEPWVPGRGFAFSSEFPPGLQGTEMWLSVVYLMADYLDIAELLSFQPRGVHRIEPGLSLGAA